MSHTHITINSLRLQAGLSQAELGARIGVVQGVVCQYETGRCRPSWETGRKMARALGVTMDQIADAILGPGQSPEQPPFPSPLDGAVSIPSIGATGFHPLSSEAAVQVGKP